MKITELIPQRNPIIMVHDVITATKEEFNTSFEITTDNIFLKNNILQEPALIENIAQSAAAGFGYLAKKEGIIKDGLGFIGAISKVIVHQLPKSGDTIKTTVTVGLTYGPITVIKGKNFLNDDLLLECEMKIVTV